MEIKTFGVMFYIRKTRTNKKGEAPVLIRITVDGVRVDTTIKKTIDPKLWDSTRGKAADKTRSQSLSRGYKVKDHPDTA